MNPLQNILSHPWINKSGVASTLYPDRENPLNNLRYLSHLRAGDKELLTEKIQELRSILDQLEQELK